MLTYGIPAEFRDGVHYLYKTAICSPSKSYMLDSSIPINSYSRIFPRSSTSRWDRAYHFPPPAASRPQRPRLINSPPPPPPWLRVRSRAALVITHRFAQKQHPLEAIVTTAARTERDTTTLPDTPWKTGRHGKAPLTHGFPGRRWTHRGPRVGSGTGDRGPTTNSSQIESRRRPPPTLLLPPVSYCIMI